MTTSRERQIVAMSKVLGECDRFDGSDAKALVWATRLWYAAHAYAGSDGLAPVGWLWKSDEGTCWQYVDGLEKPDLGFTTAFETRVTYRQAFAPIADVVYPSAMDALQVIANLPTGKSEDIMEGQEQAYRAVEALFPVQPVIYVESPVTAAMLERAAKAVEKATTQSSYGWTDEEFEIWWTKDPHFISHIKTWSDFQGTMKERLFWETRIALGAALGETA